MFHSGNEIGPFRAIEESVVAHLTEPASRSDVYAWYSLLGQAGVACGLMTCGWVIQYVSTSLQWEHVDAYRLAFLGYAAVGVIKLALTLLLSAAVEADAKASTTKKMTVSSEAGSTETSPLLGSANANGSLRATEQRPGRSRLLSLLPDISREGYAMMTSLCFFFAIDSLASGIISMLVLPFLNVVQHYRRLIALRWPCTNLCSYL